MFDFTLPENYQPIYWNLFLMVTLGMIIHTQSHTGSELKVAKFNKTSALLTFFLVTVFIGLRPISGTYFGDMATYAREYAKYMDGETIEVDKDVLFSTYMKACSSVMDVNAWFLLSAFIYISCLYWACKRMFPDYVFIAFLMCITAFSFWGYAVNGIRNGMATSILVLAISFYDRKLIAILLCVLASGIHKSTILPVGALVLAWFYPNTRLYMYSWLACIVLSNLFGGFWENLFSNLGLTEDDRFSSYLTSTENADEFSATGFRWDFLLYSSAPIAMGYYVVVKKGLKEKLYLLILNTYVIANAFWILVIRANFSNRFAYLSWFLYPVILIYPAIKFDLWKKPYAKTGIIIFLHFAFTYIMWLKG
ncbi:MAG: EpsG family protein [Prevotellaceae bacterium]|jgi:hypothetical protein|nr:EpsG family protein [Prevotellaceae bacterium]